MNLQATADNVIFELKEFETSKILLMAKSENVFGRVISKGPRVKSQIKKGDIIVTDDMTKDLSTGKIDNKLRVIKEASIIAILE